MESLTKITAPAILTAQAVAQNQPGIKLNNRTGNTGSNKSADYMPLFDTRLYRSLGLYSSGNYTENIGDGSDKDSKRGDSAMTDFYPHYSYGSYVSDYYESPASVQTELEDFMANNKGFEGTDTYKKTVEAKTARIGEINTFINTNKSEMLAPHSFIHPYAIVKLAGASGNELTVQQLFTYDKAGQRKWYEIDGNSAGGYAKNPTTTVIIKWGNEDPRGRTPYSFQDFVFCRDWNKIQNNRMITLRRYAAPVTDAMTFSDYAAGPGEQAKPDGASAKKPDAPWAPLATAVTYFGEGTDNNISDLLSFTAGYNWEELTAEANPIDISSVQDEQGSNLVTNVNTVRSGIAQISKFLGFWDTFKDEATGKTTGIDPALAANIPPDPYNNGPYENRIMGPINVIMNTYKRKRGLTFNQELKLTFHYVARPIAGINNKAVLLDLLSNILVMCYASGSWFGGMWRYKTENPAIYPFKYGDAMNKLYRGQLFGAKGAIATTVKHAYNDGKGMFSDIFMNAVNAAKNLISGAVDALVGAINGDKDKKEAGKSRIDQATSSATVRTIEKIMAARVLDSATIPYIQNQRALLTGDPVGDWHLTIGNPLNPIAMIGNLIVKNVDIKFSDELGPDDFPVGFDAIVTLAHGLGRDRDAIESMFNRGFGRIYSLPLGFRSTADGETKVDDNTGSIGDRTKYEETRNTFFGRGFRFIAKTQTSKLQNSGSGKVYYGLTKNYEAVTSLNQASAKRATSMYIIDPWQTNWCL